MNNTKTLSQKKQEIDIFLEEIKSKFKITQQDDDFIRYLSKKIL